MKPMIIKNEIPTKILFRYLCPKFWHVRVFQMLTLLILVSRGSIRVGLLDLIDEQEMQHVVCHHHYDPWDQRQCGCTI